MATANFAISWVEQGLVPDPVIRAGIRRLLKARLTEIHDADAQAGAERSTAFAQALYSASIALVPEKANEQHYEVPAEFFAKVLGHRRKYSSCWWPEGVTTLDEAEDAALAASC